MVCGSPNQDVPKPLSKLIKCPAHCKILELNTKQFYVDSNGRMFINSTHQFANVRIAIKPYWIKIGYTHYFLHHVYIWWDVSYYFYLQRTNVRDYCVTYACHQDSITWEVRADACLCYDINALNDIASSIPKGMKR